jgi:hypothetical protein
VGQRRDGRRGDVASVDRGHPPGSRGGADRVAAHHREQVLHEEDGAHDRVSQSRRLERALRVAMLTRNPQRRSLVGAKHRQLDHAPHAGAHGGVDDVALLVALPTALAREEEHAVDARHRDVEGLGTIEVADGVLGAVAQAGERALRITDERPWPLPGGREPPEHLAADRAGRARHEDRAASLE